MSVIPGPFRVTSLPSCELLFVASSTGAQVTERILQRVVNSTGAVHTRLLLAQSLAKQRKVEAAVAEFRAVRLLAESVATLVLPVVCVARVPGVAVVHVLDTSCGHGIVLCRLRAASVCVCPLRLCR
jgi:hypothetical protein